ncbi:hypothetical protein DY000_02016402 [Brassica cretica]|uniref:Uncharacterized protein n=1 Tax=Brassica cretica TaxID=69181 RepID=A0ABQ7D2D2_BRACR|nr:hypothetical protein DY000_02016402 [Brassica cretica]
MRLVLLKPKTSPFNNTPTGRVVTNEAAYQLVTTRPVGVLLKGEVLDSSNAKSINNLHRGVSEGSHVLGSSNTKHTNNLLVDVEPFPPTVRVSVGALQDSLQGTDPNPSPWEETPPHPPVACPGGVLLKGEVLGSSNAKRTNNLPVDVEAIPPTAVRSVIKIINEREREQGDRVVKTVARAVSSFVEG